MRILRERGREKRDKRDKRERKEGKERREREEREITHFSKTCVGCQGSWHFKASKASLSVRKAFLIKIREQNCMFEAT